MRSRQECKVVHSIVGLGSGKYAYEGRIVTKDDFVDGKVPRHLLDSGALVPTGILRQAQDDEGGRKDEAVGPKAEAVGSKAEAVGPKDEAVGSKAEAVGPEAEAVGSQAKAVGPEAEAGGPQAEAVGPEAEAGGPELEEDARGKLTCGK